MLQVEPTYASTILRVTDVANRESNVQAVFHAIDAQHLLRHSHVFTVSPSGAERRRLLVMSLEIGRAIQG
jgi:hypothetical protein